MNTKYPTTPPRGLPEVILKEKDCYRLWRLLLRDFPKVERLGVGTKIEQIFLIVLELTFTAAYLPPEQKIVLLSKTISKLDVLKFFTQLAWEEKLLATEKYVEISLKLEEIGKMLGGWKKGLINKTLASK